MKEPYDYRRANLLGSEEQNRRLSPLRRAMAAAGMASALISSPANIYYLTGRIFHGYLYVEANSPKVLYFVRRPNHIEGEGVHLIAKPAEMKDILSREGAVAGLPALELGLIAYADAARLASALGYEAPQGNITPVLRAVRSVKTEREQELLRQSGRKQTEVYARIPHLYQEGMSDIELQIEIERQSRLEGCLGQFRVAGTDMEIFMGNVLTGKNADTPSPYDFAMGGAGLDPSLPVGADGTIIHPGMPVMVDVNGNYTGYMTDMTRCYGSGEMPEEVVRANGLSCAICAELASMMVPGAAASALYERALQMATEGGMADYFMGHRSHAGFVGHGVGIEINELPVIAPRSRDILQEGNVIALEPKFVLPGIGAVGIENTYIVHTQAPGEKITTAPENIVRLD